MHAKIWWKSVQLLFGIPTRRRENNIKMNLKETVGEGEDCVYLAQDSS
jgi:hypothetical protein